MTEHKNWTVPEVSPDQVIAVDDRMAIFGTPTPELYGAPEAQRIYNQTLRAFLDSDFGSIACDAYAAPEIDDEDSEILGEVSDVQFTEAMIEAGIGAVYEVCGEAVGSRDANELIARRIFIAMRRAERDEGAA